ncbi:MAG: hypothetical protein NT007_14240 [Candidatus Kapabacteria bacterium]|nr:hypothetical protein [Candidatus Kapabacteria bacterium]
MDENSNNALERDKKRYDYAMDVLSDPCLTVFSIVLLPERLPIEESQSAIDGLGKLGINVQSLIINQCILPEVIEGNNFLTERSKLQSSFISEIEKRFADRIRIQLPLLASDVSDLYALRHIGKLILGD